MKIVIVWVFVLLSLTVASNNSFAECSGDICQNVYIDQLYIRDSGVNLVQTSGNEAQLSCGADSGLFLEIADTANKKDILATLLTAYSQTKMVELRVITGSIGCKIAYITLNR